MSLEEIVSSRSELFHGKAYDALTEEEKKTAEHIRREYKRLNDYSYSVGVLCRKYINEYETSIKVDTFQLVDPDSANENDDEPISELKGKRYIDFRTVDIADTVTEKAKNILKKLFQTNGNGEKVLDDLGFEVRIDSRQALNKLVQICWTSTPMSFIKDIEVASASFPWMGTLVGLMEQDEVTAAAMYASVVKAQNTYEYIILDKGYYKTKILNTKAAHNAILRELMCNFGANVLDEEYSIYDRSGKRTTNSVAAKERVNQLLNREGNTTSIADAIDTSIPGDITDEKYAPKVSGAREDGTVEYSPLLAKSGLAGMQWFLDNNEAEINALVKLAAGIGLDITGEQIRRAAMIPFNEKERKYFKKGSMLSRAKNRYAIIYSTITNLYSNLAAYSANDTAKAFLKYSDSLESLQHALCLAVYDDLDSKGRDGSKTLQTYTVLCVDTTALIRLRNDRMKSDADFLKELENNYLKYEGFTHEGEATGFLKYIIGEGVSPINPRSITNRAQRFRRNDVSSFNHVDFAEMSKQQVANTQFILWRSNGYEEPQFIVPVLADYTVCYSLSVPKEALPDIKRNIKEDNDKTSLLISGDPAKGDAVFNTKAPIVQAMLDEVLCEYDRIRAIEDRMKKEGRVELETYEKEGRQFQIFPEMNTPGFREKYEELCRKSPVDGLKYMERAVSKCLYNNYLNDLRIYQEVGAFASPEFKKNVTVDANGRLQSMKPEFATEFERFSMQTFYARQQMVKLFFIDKSHFDGLLDFEKRAMMLHAPATPLYFRNEEDAYQNVMYLKDYEAKKSVNIEQYKEMLKALVAEKKMSREMADIALKDFEKIKSTDGQGLRTLASWRKIRRALGKWTDVQENAYKAINEGHFSQSLIEDLGLSAEKYRYAGYQEIDATQTGTKGIEQKAVKVPVLHKYSEQVLLPWHKLTGLTAMERENIPMMALSRVVEVMENLYPDKTPDLFLFHSGCKVGAHDVVDPWKQKEGSSKPLTDKDIRNNILSAVATSPNAVQRLHLGGLGEAAIIDAETTDTYIHITSQAEKMAYGNTSPEDMVYVPRLGQVNAVEARRLYDDISSATVVEDWQALCDEIGDAVKARRILLKEMSNMPYVSDETRIALTKVKDYNNEIPLFSPQVQHEAQAIILSIIKKRMTKHKGPGARLVQRTSIGWDAGETNLAKLGQFSEKEGGSLKINFEGEGANKRMASVDGYVPLTDSRLKIFADKNGEITPKRLRQLVKDGTIPESYLYAVGYRTPSDAEHSLIPIKIKGFLSPLSGRNAILPMDIMKLTGHDYDGDEMPIHYKYFDLELNEEKLRNYFDNLILNKTKRGYELSEDDLYLLSKGKVDEAFETFKKAVDKNKEYYSEYYKVVPVEYDYSKSALENTEEARHNAKVELLYAQLSSPAGSRRIIIPGGCEETKRVIKGIQLLRIAQNNAALRKKITDHYGEPETTDIAKLYNMIRGKFVPKGKSWKPLDSGVIADLIREYQPKVSPFSAGHEVESFGYMIESSEMIGIFAMYLSSFQMMQKTKAFLKPFTVQTKDGDTVEVPFILFDHDFSNRNLFQIQDITSADMASRVLSRLINAAVDNGKDPLLGYANITSEVAPVVALMCALGMTEDQIYLMLAQPAIKEALKVCAVQHVSFSEALATVKANIKGLHGEALLYYGFKRATEDLGKTLEPEYAQNMLVDWNSLATDQAAAAFQVNVLSIIQKLNGPASDLQSFITSIIRPESSSGGVASSIGNTQIKIFSAEEVREKIANGSFRIGGLEEFAKPIDFEDGEKSEVIIERSNKSSIPQYALMEALEVQASMFFMQRWFPQARKSWMKVLNEIYNMYDLKSRKNKGLLDHIAKDMILFQIFSTTEYKENFKEQQEHILSELPKALLDLKLKVSRNSKNNTLKKKAIKELAAIERRRKETGVAGASAEEIAKYKQEAQLEIDNQLLDLAKNAFFKKLTVYYPEDERSKPRIAFVTGGLDASKMSDMFRTQELLEYGLFTNGFAFGSREFAHLASYFLIRTAKEGKVLSALNQVAKADYRDSTSVSRLIDQYVMNHWYDDGLVPRFDSKRFGADLAMAMGTKFNPNLKTYLVPEQFIPGRFYLIKQEDGEYELMKYVGINDQTLPFIKHEKLGTRTRSGQVTVEYNPGLDGKDMTPFQVGFESVWGDFGVADSTDSNANFDAPQDYDTSASQSLTVADMPTARKELRHLENAALLMKSLGAAPTSDQMSVARLEVLKKAHENAEKNKKEIEEYQKAMEESLTQYESGNFGSTATREYYTGQITPKSNVIMVFGSNPEGRHGAGAAKVAREQFGAEYGVGEGLTGNAYALPTKDLRVKENNSLRSIPEEEIIKSIQKLYTTAEENPTKKFMVAYRNTDKASLNGYTGIEMIEMFKAAGAIPENIIFSEEWIKTGLFTEAAPNPVEPASRTIVQADAEPMDPEDDMAYVAKLKGKSIGDSAQAASFFGGQMLSITRMREDDNGNPTVVTERVPATPNNVREARRQQAYADLNERLRYILQRVGVGVGKLSADDIIAYAENSLSVHGITDFDTAKVLANGLLEMVKISEGAQGEAALPEEFAHVAIAMLGYENPLVRRLIDALSNDEEALRQAFDGEYDLYETIYEKQGGDWRTKIVEEAAGKLVAKQLLYNAEPKSKFRQLISRVVEAIKGLFRRITRRSLEDAIFESEQISSKLAKDLLSGRLLDQMSLDNVSQSGEFYKAVKDISDAKGIIEELIKIETKRAQIYQKRLGYNQKKLRESESNTATLSNLRNLKRALKNDKTEEAVLKYLESTLDFLQRTEITLDSKVNSGAPANVLAGSLNVLRDTLFSNFKALDAIQQALNEGKITDAGNLQSTIDTVTGVVNRFFSKYKRISNTLFEGMLADVYGDEGITFTVGKNKGKHVSIHELATQGETHMLSGVSRWINSMADQDDPVLQAFDSVVRKAKFLARQSQNEYAHRLAEAIEKLHKDTGSLDQTFMFEYKDGHKTGKFLSAKEAEKLPEAQKKFYDEMMAIKHEVDKLLPQHRVKKNGIIMVRKDTMQRVKDANGVSAKFTAWKQGFWNSLVSTADEEYENEGVRVDFEGNRVDMLPVKYILKGKSESYDDMTDDVASAMMAYVGMATEHNEMNKVINTLENARFASMERNINKVGVRKPMEYVEYGDTKYSQPFTIKQAKTAVQICLDDFLSMHVYGHLRKDSVVDIRGHKVSVGKVVDKINMATTYSQMALNINQRISNITTGATQIFIQTAGRDYYNAKDVIWASKIYMKESADRLAETGSDASHNKLSLFNERFDIGQKRNDASLKKKYGKSRLTKIFNTNLLFAGLEMGEDYLSSTTGLALARNTKLKLNGKEINLYDAYEVAYTDEANKDGAYLRMKSGVTKVDGSEFTREDELNFSKTCAGINFRLQGIYNVDDRAAIQQYPAGALVMMYRKWIAPSLKRRYGGARYNELLGQEEEGYYVTFFNLAKNIITGGEANIHSLRVNWDNLTDYEK
ncbi:unnamed protein product, partial [Cylicocyclus nassatus]